MGLDSVEIVMRVEEIFGISLSDQECASADTVGAMFRLILAKLQVPYETAVFIEESASGRDLSGGTQLRMIPWTTDDIWKTLRGIICDQLQTTLDEVRESATFIGDLGCV